MSLTLQVLNILNNIQKLVLNGHSQQAQEILLALYRIIFRLNHRLFTNQSIIEAKKIMELAVEAFNNGTFLQQDYSTGQQISWSSSNPIDALGALSQSLLD